MPTLQSITLSFDFPVNDSVQVGDVAYYTTQSTTGPHTFGGSIVYIGQITAVTDISITCNIWDYTPRPTSNDFIMFSKDNAVNMTSLIGYYAQADFENNSTDHAEIFSVGSEIFESSR